MDKYFYCVNTFVNSEPIQLCGIVDAISKYDAIKTLITKGNIDSNAYEFLELKVVEE